MSRLDRISNQAAALSSLAKTVEHLIEYHNQELQKYEDKYSDIVFQNQGEVTQEAEVMQQLANKAFDSASIYESILEYINNYQF